MVTRDFHIAKREEDIGYYAGFVGECIFYTSSLMMGFIHDWQSFDICLMGSGG
ncbi:hypothetical protein Patl1_05575 [Pistacia atlantica]|uniref:Uncharacterized protein n=1 Tax=Pistacia atlantica TaxID=434234 RepID=A0ACC1BQ04_9ROSI|nr:hypothetical protein Patl1_05575 [Pistacia atlantica]